MVRDMHVQQVREALSEVWGSGGRRFATFEDADDENHFVQYLDGQLNVAWPRERSPEDALRSARVALPGSAFVISWTAFGTAQIAVGDLLLDDVAALIVRILTRVFDAWEIEDRIDDDR
jgi:hypothetical protein